MKLFSNISIHRKLIIIQLITSFLAVFLCAVIFLIIDFSFMKENKLESISSISEVISTNTIAPLMFEDNEAAEENLKDLNVDSDIERAWIYKKDLSLFASFHKKGLSNSIPAKISKNFKSYQFEDYYYSFTKINNEEDEVGYILIQTSLKSLQSQLYKKIFYTSLVIFSCVLIAFFFASIFQNYISKPILKLVALMQKVKKTKNFKLRSDLDTKDEIGKLAEVFNDMLEQIEQHDKSLLETNNLLESKVEERTSELLEKNEKLVEAKIQAEKSKLVKEQFLASMSHEIRTPLNAILGFQDLLKSTKLSKEQQEYVNSIDFAGKNLLVIINDILDISKIEAGKFIFEESQLNIRENLKSVLELLENRSTEKKLEIKTTIDKNIPNFVLGDDARLSQILLNLIGNSIKFTEKGIVSIDIKLISNKDNLVNCQFKISDTGIGISQEHLHQIFDRFTQASSETNRKYGGTGLGLTIVQQLIELQGGKIEVESELKKGSTFTFNLPFKTSTQISTNTLSISNSNFFKTDFENITILLVEDMILNQNLVKKIMEKWKIKLQVVNNGIEALAKLKEQQFDLILMDIQMPEMDGYETTRHIRKSKNKAIKSIPIIALTAHASNSEAEKCINLGMNAYLAKPFNAENLKKLIIQHTAKKSTSIRKAGSLKKHYNLDYLIEHADGDRAFLKDMIDIFLKDSPVLIDDLKISISERDYNKIKISSHSMKGVFLTLGIKRAGKLIREIELMAGKNERIELIEKNCSEIESIYLESKMMLEEEMKLI